MKKSKYLNEIEINPFAKELKKGLSPATLSPCDAGTMYIYGETGKMLTKIPFGSDESTRSYPIKHTGTACHYSIRDINDDIVIKGSLSDIANSFVLNETYFQAGGTIELTNFHVGNICGD